MAIDNYSKLSIVHSLSWGFFTLAFCSTCMTCPDFFFLLISLKLKTKHFESSNFTCRIYPTLRYYIVTLNRYIELVFKYSMQCCSIFEVVEMVVFRNAVDWIIWFLCFCWTLLCLKSRFLLDKSSSHTAASVHQ